MRQAFISKHFLRAIACAAMSAMLLASCGGGGGGGSGQTSAPQAAQTAAASSVSGSSAGSGGTAVTASVQPAQLVDGAAGSASAGGPPRVIEYYGDSTIWGYTPFTGEQVSVPAPAAFAAALPAGGNYDVRNEGVSGSTACGLLNGSDGKHPAWSTQMANSSASIVIMNFAINDEWRDDLPTYQSCLTQLARQAKSAGKKVVFETPNPTRDSGPSGLDVYVDAMKAVAAQERLPVIDQYRYLTDYLNGQSPLSICPDGLHPTAEVYVMKGKYAASVFPSLPL